MVIQLKQTTENWQAVALRLGAYFAAKGYTNLRSVQILQQANVSDLVLIDFLNALFLKIQHNQYSPSPKRALLVKLTSAEARALMEVSAQPNDTDGSYEFAFYRTFAAEIDRAIVNSPMAPAEAVIPSPARLTFF